jgi:hypothetical protein
MCNGKYSKFHNEPQKIHTSPACVNTVCYVEYDFKGRFEHYDLGGVLYEEGNEIPIIDYNNFFLEILKDFIKDV